MWHTEDHKAYRMAVAGDHPPDPAKELEEPTEGGLDAPMIAVWSDGTKNQLLDYSLRDHRQWQKLQAETEELPTHMVEMIGEDKITVKTRRLSSATRGGRLIICILKNGDQLTQLIVDAPLTVDHCVEIMTKLARDYIAGTISLPELKKMKKKVSDDKIKELKQSVPMKKPAKDEVKPKDEVEAENPAPKPKTKAAKAAAKPKAKVKAEEVKAEAKADPVTPPRRSAAQSAASDTIREESWAETQLNEW